MPDPEDMLWEKKDKKSPPIILILVAVVAVLGLIIWAVVALAGEPAPVQVEVAPSTTTSVPAVKTEPQVKPPTGGWTLEKLKQVVAQNTPIYFVKDSIKLLPGEMKKVENMVEALKNFKNVMLKFRGHTADVNLDVFQLSLSRARANRIRWAFEYREGYNISAVEMVGLGSKELVSKGDTDAKRAPNRRVEVIVQHAEPAK